MNAPTQTEARHVAFMDIGTNSIRLLIVRVLSLLLRFAESLDRSHAGNVRHAGFRLKSGAHAGLYIYAVQDCQIELWAVQKHVAAFEKMLGCKLDVREAADEGQQAD